MKMNFIRRVGQLSLLLSVGSQLVAMQTFVVGNLNDSGDGSLRQAIVDSNENAGPWSNIITFTIAGTIKPETDLPDITQTVLIDGYSAPDAFPNTNSINQANNAVITVELQGPGAGLNLSTLNGLSFLPGADGSIVQGLCINSFASVDLVPNSYVNGNGIYIGCTDVTIQGNFIGTDTTGTLPLINAQGVFIDFPTNNTLVGGATNAARNLLAGAVNTQQVIFNLSSGQTTIQGNTIGLTAKGDTAFETGTNFGIFSLGAPLIIANNVISGHSAANIDIFFEIVNGTQTITNNIIGLDVTGSFSVGPNGFGLFLGSFIDLPVPCTISFNNISGNTSGIVVGLSVSPAVIGVQITNNLIGTDTTGSYAVPNSIDGISLPGALNTFIGSNVISNNGHNGITSHKAKNTTIKSNFIGTDITGSIVMGNTLNGIQLGTVVGAGVPSFGDIVGGALYGEGNLIANNGGYGIQVVSYTQQETIQGNYIYNNALDGIRLGPKSKNNWVGGFRNAGNNLLTGELQSQGYVNLGPLGTSNYIAQNGGYGISAVGSNGNAIQTNIVVDNGSDGITLVDSSDNLVGGKVALAKPAVEIPPVLGNVITGNGGFGVSVVVQNGKADNNTILSNEIFGNDDAGIIVE